MNKTLKQPKGSRKKGSAIIVDDGKILFPTIYGNLTAQGFLELFPNVGKFFELFRKRNPESIKELLFARAICATQVIAEDKLHPPAGVAAIKAAIDFSRGKVDEDEIIITGAAARRFMIYEEGIDPDTIHHAPIYGGYANYIAINAPKQSTLLFIAHKYLPLEIWNRE